MNDKKRNGLTDKVLVDDNLEYDYLSSTEIVFEEFPTPEKVYVVRQSDLNRMDIISFNVYGNPNYWWLIALRNGIIDTRDDMFMGKKLYIPNLSDFYTFMNRKKKKSKISNKGLSTRRL